MCKKKIISLSGILLVICLLLAVGNAKAHKPSNMSLKYTLSNNSLEVTIIHSVSDPYTHYIYKLDIIYNGTTTTDYKIYQPTSSSYKYYYTVIANLGDYIEVIAYCVQRGFIYRFIEVEEPTIPGYFGFYFIIGFSIIFLLSFIRKKIEKVVK